MSPNMDCKTTSIKRGARRRAGLTLMEMCIAIPIIGLMAVVAGELIIFGARSFGATSNYLEMETDSRVALDNLSRDVRQAQDLVSFDAQRLVFLDYDNVQLEYIYSPTSKTLTRIKGDSRKVLLQGCNYLQFSVFQRTPIASAYQFYPCTSAATAKLVQIRWLCSRSVPGSAVDTESIQNAAVVIRKKKAS